MFQFFGTTSDLDAPLLGEESSQARQAPRDEPCILPMHTSTAEEIHRTGFIGQRAEDQSHAQKMLEYDAKGLTRGAGPWRALFSEARHHTILRYKGMKLELVRSFQVAYICSPGSCGHRRYQVSVLMISEWSSEPDQVCRGMYTCCPGSCGQLSCQV